MNKAVYTIHTLYITSLTAIVITSLDVKPHGRGLKNNLIFTIRIQARLDVTLDNSTAMVFRFITVQITVIIFAVTNLQIQRRNNLDQKDQNILLLLLMNHKS